MYGWMEMKSMGMKMMMLTQTNATLQDRQDPVLPIEEEPDGTEHGTWDHQS